MVVGPFVDVQLHIPVVAEGARHHPWRTYIKRCDLEMQQTYITLVLAPTALIGIVVPKHAVEHRIRTVAPEQTTHVFNSLRDDIPRWHLTVSLFVLGLLLPSVVTDMICPALVHVAVDDEIVDGGTLEVVVDATAITLKQTVDEFEGFLVVIEIHFFVSVFFL